MSKTKPRRERTPRDMLARIIKQNGGGGHRDKRSDYRRKEKHRTRDGAW